MQAPVLVYLHGFLSSPQSAKARLLGAAARARGARWCCPQLPDDPAAALELATKLAREAGPAAVLVGSSLGGFYASRIAQEHPARLVLLNPAIEPHSLPAAHCGPQVAADGRTVQVTAAHLESLRGMCCPAPAPAQRTLLVVSEHDEVIEPARMLAHYRGSRSIVLPGQGHAMEGFDQALGDVLQFCGLGVPDGPAPSRGG
jgi:predicted esterase YcpF (UPF0227 family)